MPTGSGLDSQVGVGVESVWGTPVTPDRFYEFNSEGLTMEPSWLEPSALRSGVKYKRENRVRQSRRTVSGDLVIEHATRGMGRLWKHALGSALSAYTQIAAGPAYAGNFTPGDFRGLGLTIQVGRPEPGTGTVRAYTYAGCKCTGWEFSVRDEEVPTLSLTFDGRSESTATGLAVASYLASSGVFDFSQATLKLGGTATTATGRTTIAGGTAISTIVREFSISGEVPMATERFGLGNAGLKSEPLENDTPTITGSLGAEFNQAELYAAFANNTTTAMEMRLTGPVITPSAEFETLEIICPAVKMKSAAPNVGGPDIVEMSTDFEAYSDGTNPTIQVRIITPETTI
jgi:hypothetical protein